MFRSRYFSKLFGWTLAALLLLSVRADAQRKKREPFYTVPQAFPQSIDSRSFLRQTRDLSYLVFSDVRIKAGANIGVTAPFGIPEGVSTRSFAPIFAPLIEIDRDIQLINWLYLTVGMRVEYKGMRSLVFVHDYSMSVTQDLGGGLSAKVAGTFTGYNQTNMVMTYFTVPLRLSFRVSNKNFLQIGGYAAYGFAMDFYGSVSDGFMWTKPEAGAPSQKILIPYSEYNFEKNLSPWDAGVDFVVSHFFTPWLFMDFGCSVGLMNIFKKGFKGVAFPMHNMYASLSMGYQF